MLKAVLSHKDLTKVEDYYRCVSDLLRDRNVLRLDDFGHHFGATRFQHSLNVSYYNYLLCRFFHLNAKAAARAGLLHDFFFYDRKDHIKTERTHAAEHAHTAFINASEMFPLTELEGDMIINHMWPMTTDLPRHPETFMITVADKFCCLAEIMCCALCAGTRKIRLAESFALMLILRIITH